MNRRTKVAFLSIDDALKSMFIMWQKDVRQIQAAMRFLGGLPYQVYDDNHLLFADGLLYGRLQDARKNIADLCDSWFDNSAFKSIEQRVDA